MSSELTELHDTILHLRDNLSAAKADITWLNKQLAAKVNRLNSLKKELKEKTDRLNDIYDLVTSES